MPAGKSPKSERRMPKREPATQGLYISVSTSAYSGLIRNPHDIPAA